MCLWITWTYLRSVEVLLLTWAHVFLILLWCCLSELCFFLLWTYRIAQDYLTISQTIQDYGKNCAPVCTFTVYISCNVMASGDVRNSQPASDQSGQTFWCEMRTSWDPPKTYVDITSPGVVVLDTTVVPDMVGLHAYDDKAADADPEGFPAAI